jgi:DOPA 4,5-dioxygenase
MHAHIYFTAQNQNVVEEIREGFFSTRWSLFVGGLKDNTIGPHRQKQFEVHFLEADLIKAVKHFTLFRKNISILVHQVSENDFLDHTENCFWLGDELELDYSKLDKEGENKATKRFSYNEAN